MKTLMLLVSGGSLVHMLGFGYIFDAFTGEFDFSNTFGRSVSSTGVSDRSARVNIADYNFDSDSKTNITPCELIYIKPCLSSMTCSITSFCYLGYIDIDF